ncbi:hypothetical protein [Pseudoalteromonas rubra]|uniref:Uncharacterized protein n=1 Tax=Pseudoalteromonas rubra TaxID=43658 RepID=A0A0F4R1S8_9GAMM|nr:hypothetical protein [Pseudoalteromonas rubra]KJZ12782.1 hypothetical protein TW77_02205 [Pseudoalteromonas rubra]
MLTKDNTTVLCPYNDLEASCILALAEQYGIEAIRGPSVWGVTLYDALQSVDLANCHTHLLAIELPDPEKRAEALLNQHGITLHRLDHHQYTGNDARHTQTAIEQFANLFDIELTRYHQLVAANDKGFIPGLLAAGANYAQMCEIREQEARIRGVEALRDSGFEWFKANCRAHSASSDEVLYLTCPDRLAPVMSEVAQFPNEQTYTRAQQSGQNLMLRQVVISYQQDALITQLEVLARQGRENISALVANWPYGGLSAWFGGEAPGYYFGAVSKTEPQACQSEFNALHQKVKHYL